MNRRKVRSRQHVVGRAAVNAVRAFFESRSQIYHEVDQANDYGIDAYIDLVSEGVVTGKVIAIQVKGGRSYKTKSGYFIPYDAADRTRQTGRCGRTHRSPSLASYAILKNPTCSGSTSLSIL
jgi:hypothetical protein